MNMASEHACAAQQTPLPNRVSKRAKASTAGAAKLLSAFVETPLNHWHFHFSTTFNEIRPFWPVWGREVQPRDGWFIYVFGFVLRQRLTVYGELTSKTILVLGHSVQLSLFFSFDEALNVLCLFCKKLCSVMEPGSQVWEAYGRKKKAARAVWTSKLHQWFWSILLAMSKRSVTNQWNASTPATINFPVQKEVSMHKFDKPPMVSWLPSMGEMHHWHFDPYCWPCQKEVW